jgi:hypothetical protein
VKVKASHPEGDPWVLVADVLARVAGVDPSRSFDAEAEALASTMRGVRRDWDGRPMITSSRATELRDSLKAEQARRRELIEARLVEADQRFRAQLPRGIPAGAVPEGISAGQLMMLTDPERQRVRRRSVLEDALAHVGTVFTPIRDEQ